MLGNRPLTLGKDETCDIQLGSYGFTGGTLELSAVGKKLQLLSQGGNSSIKVNGATIKPGFLKYKGGQFSLVIDQSCFFLVKIGSAAKSWSKELESSGKNSWKLLIFESDKQFEQWRGAGLPADMPGLMSTVNLSMLDLISEVGKREWNNQKGVVYHEGARAGFFAKQFRKIAHPEELPDAGDHRCPRCWMRFNTGNILAVHPTEYGDDILGESVLKRFSPTRFDVSGRPETPEGVACSKLACPHCRGELPANLIEKAPHILSIVGDSMSGKSYFLTVAVHQLKRELPRKFEVNFTDADTGGNEVVSDMVKKLFNPQQNPEIAALAKTQLAGATYSEHKRGEELVNLPNPFTYNLISRDRENKATVILYDNAGEHFRPGNTDREKSNTTEHIAWASGILFLFDPFQHRSILKLLDQDADPQIKAMKSEANLRLDQEVVLAEIAQRISLWKQTAMGQDHDVPLALIIGKHDALHDHLPLDGLQLDVCPEGRLSMDAIQSNSSASREFLLDHCPDIVGAVETITDRVMYFPASSFGSPAIKLKGAAEAQFGPDPTKLSPYLIEAPFLWILSQVEPDMFPQD